MEKEKEKLETAKERVNRILLYAGMIMMLIVSIGILGSHVSENYDCYDMECKETTLDKFDECIDLGFETVGFMASEHFWLCDGVKVTSKCLRYGKIENSTNPTFSNINSCEYVGENKTGENDTLQ